MSKGILKGCSSCKKNDNCCCNFNIIDYPILSAEEYNKLITYYKIDPKHFKKLNGDCYNIVAKDGVCPFYDKKCTIYKDRPNDCRLFPFDIKIMNNKYYLIVYKLECFDVFNMMKENVDDVVDCIRPYIEVFTKEELNKKLEVLPYIIIKEIKL